MTDDVVKDATRRAIALFASQHADLDRDQWQALITELLHGDGPEGEPVIVEVLGGMIVLVESLLNHLRVAYGEDPEELLQEIALRVDDIRKLP